MRKKPEVTQRAHTYKNTEKNVLLEINYFHLYTSSHRTTTVHQREFPKGGKM